MDEPKDLSERVKSLTENAIVHMISGNGTKALECYQEAFKLSLDVGTPQQVLSCVCNYGASCIVNNRAEEAILLLEEHVAKVEGVECEDDNFFTLKGDIHYNLALAYNIKSQYDLAITNLTCAIQIFESKSIVKTLAESYQQLGDICSKCGKKEEAKEAYSQAAATFRNDGDILSEGKTYMKVAKMHWDDNETGECLKQLQKCEKVCAILKKDSSAKVTKLIYDLAMMFKKLKESDKALKWLKNAAEKNLHHNPSDEDVKVQAVIAQNLGKLSIETRDYNNAVEMYLKAASYFGQLGNTKSRAWCFYHLGGIFLMLKDSRNAEKNYHVAYQMLEDTGSINHLWKIKEGLGDLYAVTYQYAKSVTFYKESLALIGIHSSRNVRKDQKRIVEKLSAVLDSQKNGGKRDIHISYNSRKPVVLPLNIESTLEYSSIGLPPKPSQGPMSSTPIDREGKKSRHRRDGRKKKGKKRRDLLHAPVPNGVTEYDSGSDMSLVEKEMQKQLSLSCSMRSQRSFSLPKNLENTYEIPDGIKDNAGTPNRSASQGDLKKNGYSKNGEQRSSRDEDEDDMKEERRRSWNIFRSRKKSDSTDRNGNSSSDSDSASLTSHQQTTSGTQTIPLYATVSKTNSITGEISANFFSDAQGSTSASGDHMSSTIPSRWAPDPPGPPTLPPMDHHPSILKRIKHKSESSASEADNPGVYPDTPVMNSMTRGEREAGLFETAKEEEEFWQQQHSSPHHVYRKALEERRKTSVQRSRMCLVM